MSRRLHPPLNFGGIASLVQDDEGNCGWMARIISDLAPPAGISQGLGVAIKLNAPPHTESTPFAPFDMRLRVHGMQQGARTRATPIPLRRRVRWMPRNGVRFLGIFGNISCNIILKFCNFTIWVGRDSLGTSIWKYNKKTPWIISWAEGCIEFERNSIREDSLLSWESWGSWIF